MKIVSTERMLSDIISTERKYVERMNKHEQIEL